MTPSFTIEFYCNPSGAEPVRIWARDLSPFKRRALGVALEVILASQGQDVCGSEWGKNLGQGLFEFRPRSLPPASGSENSAADEVLDKYRLYHIIRI